MGNIDFVKIKEYNEKIRDLLKENPELLKVQNELNSRLHNISDSFERQRIIQEMMLETWFKITNYF